MIERENTDTSTEAQNIQIALLQKKTPRERFELMRRLSSTVLNLSKRALQRSRRDLDNAALTKRLVSLNYDQILTDRMGFFLGENQMMQSSDLVAAAEPVVRALTDLGVTYYIGGSIASSVYGVARATLDVDMVSYLKKEQVRKFIELLHGQYYVSEPMILDAIERSLSFNLIHLPTAIKIDIFISKQRPYDAAAAARIRKDVISDETDAVQFYVASPEDVLLAKLEWFKRGGQVSERQWSDILGVLRVQGDNLDMDYLNSWSQRLSIQDLLQRAFGET